MAEETEEINQKKDISDLNLTDVQKLIGAIRAIINKLEGIGEDSGLLDKMNQANELLEKSVLDIDGSANSLQEAIKIVQDFNEKFSKLSSELDSFKTAFDKHNDDIQEYNSLYSSQVIKYSEEFIKDVEVMIKNASLETKQSLYKVKLMNKLTFIVSNIGWFVGGVAIACLTISMLFLQDITNLTKLKKAGVEILSSDNAVLINVPSSHSKIGKKSNTNKMIINIGRN